MPRPCAWQTTRENFPPESPSHYYKLSLLIPLIDTLLSGLKRRLEGNQKCIFEGLHIGANNYGWLIKKQYQYAMERTL